MCTLNVQTKILNCYYKRYDVFCSITGKKLCYVIFGEDTLTIKFYKHKGFEYPRETLTSLKQWFFDFSAFYAVVVVEYIAVQNHGYRFSDIVRALRNYHEPIDFWSEYNDDIYDKLHLEKYYQKYIKC